MIDELELDKKFRGMISHLILGYECNIKKEDFDKIIDNCIKITQESGQANSVDTVSANQRAKRWAMMNFDEWNEVTGFVDPHIGYYDEITALIEDAVEFGYGVALKQPLKEIMKVIKNRITIG